MLKQRLLAVFSAAVILALMASASANIASVSAQGGTPAATAAGTSAAMKEIPGSGKVKGPADGEAKALNATGATFPIPLYTKWIDEYNKVTGVKINYGGGGSGQGRKDISAKSVDFAGSDAFMSDKELADAKGGEIVHIPTTVGGIVPVYNIPELKGKDALKFTGETIAGIYLGDIKTWNDPKLVADNPALKDVNKPITPIYRSDGSGTTGNFTLYLSSQSKDFNDKIGAGTAVKFPVGRGANGNPNVASEVKQNEYTIGYVEVAFAKDLQSGTVKNKAGKFVAANADSISKAAAGLKLPDDLRIVLISNQSSDEGAYPISTFTWILVYTTQEKADVALALTRFLWWGIHDGQKFAGDLGYAPLPAEAITKAEALILKIKVGGKQALPADIATPAPAATATK